MDGTTILIILAVFVVIVIAAFSSGSGDNASRDEVGDRAHSANRFDDRGHGGMDDGGGE